MVTTRSGKKVIRVVNRLVRRSSPREVSHTPQRRLEVLETSRSSMMLEIIHPKPPFEQMKLSLEQLIVRCVPPLLRHPIFSELWKLLKSYELVIDHLTNITEEVEKLRKNNNDRTMAMIKNQVMLLIYINISIDTYFLSDNKDNEFLLNYWFLGFELVS